MITERKPLGAIDSNVTRVQPTRAAKTGHKWFSNRQHKPDQVGSSKLPQHRSYLQHLAQQQSQKQDATSEQNRENRNQNEVVNDSFRNLKQHEKYNHASYQNKNCSSRVPLQTIAFDNASSSTFCFPNNNNKRKPTVFPPVMESTTSDQHVDSDVSLRSISEDEVSESFLNRSQSGKKFQNSSSNENTSQNKKLVQLNEIIDEYLPDILAYLRESEIKYKPKANYLDKQTEVTSVMRIKLIDWLIEVQDEYKLHNETLYLAVAFVDRFLSEMSVSRAKLQLLGKKLLSLNLRFSADIPASFYALSCV